MADLYVSWLRDSGEMRARHADRFFKVSVEMP